MKKWNAKAALRGVTILPEWLRDYESSSSDPAYGGRTPREVLREWNVNLLRVEIVEDPAQDVTLATYESDRAAYTNWLNERLGWIKGALELLRQDGIAIIVDMHDPFGGPIFGQKGTYQLLNTDDPLSHRIRADYIQDMASIAATFRNDMQVVGIDLLNEPSGDAQAWNALVVEAARAIRNPAGPNSSITLIIEPMLGNSNFLPKLNPIIKSIPGPVVFSIHFYDPRQFTRYTVDRQEYEDGRSPKRPSSSNAVRSIRDMKSTIDKLFEKPYRWQRNNKVRLYVGEFSASLVPNTSPARKKAVADYLAYVSGKFESFGWDSSYHSFRESPYWDLEKNFGADKGLWKRSKLTVRWGKNSPARF